MVKGDRLLAGCPSSKKLISSPGMRYLELKFAMHWNDLFKFSLIWRFPLLFASTDGLFFRPVFPLYQIIMAKLLTFQIA
jgi:hypothetical protein